VAGSGGQGPSRVDARLFPRAAVARLPPDGAYPVRGRASVARGAVPRRGGGVLQLGAGEGLEPRAAPRARRHTAPARASDGELRVRRVAVPELLELRRARVPGARAGGETHRRPRRAVPREHPPAPTPPAPPH